MWRRSECERKRRKTYPFPLYPCSAEGVKKMQEAHPDVDIYMGRLMRSSMIMAILFRDLAMPEIVFSEQNKKLTENRTEMKERS